MMEERKVPALRFQGFTDEWEAQLFGSFAARESKAQISSKAYPCVEYEDIIAGEGVLNKDVRSKGISKKGIKFDNTMVLYGKLRPYLHNMLVPEFSGVAVGDWWVLRPGNVNRRFLYTLLQTKEFDDKANQSSGSKMPRADWNLISRSAFYIPNLSEEQSKIGAAFANLDWLIFSCKEQLAKLQAFKKSMLEKMFPRPCEKVPEVRFRGFTGDWEKRKLGSIFEEYSEKNHAELPPLMIVQGGGTILRDESDRSLQYDRSNLSSYKMVNKDDFIVHLRSFEGGLEKASSQGIISPAYHTFHGEGIDARFYYAYFRSAVFIRHDLKPHVYGIRDGRSIDIEGMKSILIPYTSYEEQKKIGNCISLLDQLIMLCQRKLEKLQSMKQAMLSEMFI